MTAPPPAEAVLDGGLVGDLPDGVARRLAAATGVRELRQVPAASHKQRSSNAWFRGEHDGVPVFVKLYARSDRAAVDATVAALVPPAMTTELLARGTAGALGAYAVFRWADLTPVPGTPDGPVLAGTLLAALHDVKLPPPPAGPPPAAVGEEAYGLLLDSLAAQAPHLFAEVRGRLTGPAARALVRAAGDESAGHPQVLLHGDFSLRNIARDTRGRGVVFDFERALRGPREHDLERLWDRELAYAAAARERFAAAYRAGREHDPGPFDRVQLDYARLTCAVSTLTAARRTGDAPFERQGRRILEALR